MDYGAVRPPKAPLFYSTRRRLCTSQGLTTKLSTNPTASAMISIVIPAFNEARSLPETLETLQHQEGSFEVIVVDGHSSDSTLEIASRYLFAQGITSARGRGRQMNEGARRSQGEFILFLHADTLLPPGVIAKLNALEKDPGCLAGGFHQRFRDSHPALRLLSWLHNIRAASSRLFYGDQALFVRRALFWELGGYRESGVMEDVALGIRLLERTRPLFLPDTVQVASRKFRAMGVWRGFFHVIGIFVAYNWFPKAVSGQETFFGDFR